LQAAVVADRLGEAVAVAVELCLKEHFQLAPVLATGLL
jgi:hypothetical protein